MHSYFYAVLCGSVVMTITVQATYENGTLKLEQPLPLNDHEKVQVTIQSATISPVEPGRQSLAERIVARARALPPEVLNALPNDLAAQHDHYLYGSPKRPE
jgi:predicted DNA-binding antitoxin AbrB/MazE fold protein